MTRSENSAFGPSPGESSEARFSRLYADHGRAVLAYALPRAAGPEDAADVVAETFLVAWRRARDVPAGEEARLWLLGVARRTLANQRRGEIRRARLGERLRSELGAAVMAQPEPQAEGGPMTRALERMSTDDRELLLLSGREELKSPQIARVLGISAAAARTRLHRARRRLRAELATEEGTVGVSCANGFGFEEG
jgi:RNA polymerase sigma-70 factor (ECF subfamily)